jgi:hypothetical protein
VMAVAKALNLFGLMFYQVTGAANGRRANDH